MSFLSVLTKTCALALAWRHPVIAAACWLAGLAADVLAHRKAAGPGHAALVARRVAAFNLAALAVGLAAAAASDYAAMRWKLGVPLLADMLAALLRLAGLPVAAHDGQLVLTTMAGPLESAVSLGRLGLQVPLVFLALAAAWLLANRPTLAAVLRPLGLIAGLLLVVALVRTACGALLFLGLSEFVGYETEELPFRPFAGEAGAVWLHLPFLLAAGVLFHRLLGPAAPPGRDPLPLPRTLRWAALPALVLLGTAILWQPAGSLKSGKVVLSTHHAQWSRTDRPYDREWYGADSGYNYACLKRLFETFYPVVEAAGPLDSATLADASVLVVYDPDRRLGGDEIRAVREFVRGGGGLLVIGDHTNVFGSSSHLNELCEPFGFQYRDDVLFDLDADFHQLIDRPPLASRFWHGMSFFKLRGPCSIRPTALATRCIYQVGNSKAVRAIYSVNNFYPPPHDDPKMSTGTFCVATAAHHGRGRVVAWGDSTVFSNFEIFYPGKYEFLLNSLDWLNRKDGMLAPIAGRLLPLVALAALAVFLARRRDPRVWLATAASLAVAWFAAHAATRWLEQRRATFPTPAKTADWVFFAADPADPGHNLRGFVPPESVPYDQRYEVFTQWILRTGAFAGFHLLGHGHPNGLHHHLRAGGKARTANALIVRTPADLALLDAFAAGPAQDPAQPVLLMFASSVSAEQAGARLQQSGLLRQPAALAQLAGAWPAGEALVEEEGRRILVVANAERFSDQTMGITEKVTPNETQRALFEQAFGLVGRLFPQPASPAGGS